MNLEPPRFELARVYDDGRSEIEIVPITRLPLDARMNRRGFLGAGMTITAALSFVGCAPFPTQEQFAQEKLKRKLHYCDGIKADKSIVSQILTTIDGRYLISSGDSIKIWELPEGRLTKTFKAVDSGILKSIVVTPDGRYLITSCSENPGAVDYIKFWSLPDGELIKSLNQTDSSTLAVIQNSHTLVSAHKKVIQLLDVPNGNIINSLTDNEILPNVLVVTPHGKYLISAGDVIGLRELPSGQVLKSWKGHDSNAIALAVTPDSRVLASGGYDNTIKLWSLPEGKLLHSFNDSVDAIHALAISPDGNTLISGHHGGQIILWSLSERKLIKVWLGDLDTIQSLAVTHDGQYFYSASGGNIKRWSLPDGEPSSCLMDPTAMKADEKAITYTISNQYGQEITYTLPCGSTIPADAICTCNCVPGTNAPPKPSTPLIPSGYGYCTCNKVCTCIPVCQAHRLLHPDLIVRRFAEQLLFIMGAREFPYMEWAASTANPILRTRIRKIMQSITSGATADPNHWPNISECLKRLNDSDEIVAIMAAQMLWQHVARGAEVEGESRALMLHWLANAQASPWYMRYNA